MKNQNLLSQTIKFVLLGGASALIAMPAFAQDESDTDEDTLAPVEVTGSRIKRADAENAQPVAIITREAIERSGKTSFGELLQSLPEVGPALNTGVNNGGDGSTNVSLRSLGASRTLVLMNGRRWVPGLNGTVDLNTIPTGIIETIEVLKDGASAVYGSDAIAGVINIITRKNLDGASANAFYGQSSEGDGTRYSADFTFGFTGERGSATVSAGFVNEDEIRAGDRAISSVPNFGLPGLGGSGSTPQGTYGIGPSGGFTFNAAGQPTGAGPNGSFLTNTGPGSSATAPNAIAGYRPFTQLDTYNFAPDNYLITPQERASIFAEGSYELTDWATFNTHMLFNNRKSSQELAAMPVTLGLSGSGLTAGIRPAANNPYNPFGADVTRISRRFQEGGPRRFEQSVDTFRFGGGFTGAFDAMDRTFDWDTGFNYTRNTNSTTTAGLYNTARIRNALTAIDDPRTTAFDPVCVNAGTTAATFTAASIVGAGCVPLNIFGGNGSITPAMLSYLRFTAQDKFQTESTNYFASMSTTIAETDAGPIGIAAGYEHRKEEGFDLPDAIIAAGETTGNARLPTGGQYSLDEFYAEALVPLLADQPFAELLELRFAGRYSDYTNFGDDTNLSAGFQWKPISDLKVRGNYNEGLRAPSITELFRGRSDSFPALTDPCSLGPIGTFAQQAATTQANCRNGVNGIAGVPANFAQANQQIRITLGGEPTLTPESSKSYTLGVVYSPEAYVDNLDFNVDYWKVEITNRLIASRGPATILIQCYRDADPGACSRIARNAGGEVSELVATNENAGAQDIRGIDFGVAYRLPDMEIGQFGARVDSTYYMQNNTTNLAFNPTTPFNYFTNNPENQNVAFAGTTPRMRSVGDFNWMLDAWSVNWKSRYIHRSVATCAQLFRANNPGLCTQPTNSFLSVAGTPLLLARDSVGGTTFHDVSVAYKTSFDSSLRVGINNVFDKEPPVQRDGTTNSYDSAVFDVPGSYYFVSFSQKF